MSDKARNRGECAGGFPIGDLPCALCGATEGDVCGKISGETYAQGLKIVALTSRAEAAEAQVAALREAANAVSEAWVTAKGASAISSACAVLTATLAKLPASPATERLQARVKELEGALTDLRVAESNYRNIHDLRGDNHIETGRAWDAMRDASHRAASALKGEG